MIVVKGVRRTGKSSLIRVALRIAGVPYMLVDARLLAPLTADTVYDVLAQAATGMLRRHGRCGRLREALASVRGLSVAGLSVVFERRSPTSVLGLVEALDRWASEAGVQVVLVLDEAQELRVIRGFAKLLAHVYDYHSRVKLVLAGSEVGVLDRLLGRGDPSAPLYGRPFTEITMGRLSRERALEFLRLGFSELGVSVGEQELVEAVDLLDGVIGWLTYYGYYAYLEGHEEALKRTIEEGSRLVAKELEAFLSVRAPARTRYLVVLRSLVEPRTWSEVRRSLAAYLGRLPHPQQVTRYLKELVDYGFAVKEGDRYRLADPLIAEALKYLR